MFFNVMLPMIFHIFLTHAPKVPGTKPNANVKLLLFHVIIIISIIMSMVALYFTVRALTCTYSVLTVYLPKKVLVI